MLFYVDLFTEWQEGQTTVFFTSYILTSMREWLSPLIPFLVSVKWFRTFTAVVLRSSTCLTSTDTKGYTSATKLCLRVDFINFSIQSLWKNFSRFNHCLMSKRRKSPHDRNYFLQILNEKKLLQNEMITYFTFYSTLQQKWNLSRLFLEVTPSFDSGYGD